MPGFGPEMLALVLQEHVEGRVDPAGGVHDPSPAKQQPGAHEAASPAPPRSRYSTAIRIATPFVTWSRITE